MILKAYYKFLQLKCLSTAESKYWFQARIVDTWDGMSEKYAAFSFFHYYSTFFIIKTVKGEEFIKC